MSLQRLTREEAAEVAAMYDQTMARPQDGTGNENVRSAQLLLAKAARTVLFLLAGFLIILGLAALAQAEAAQSALDPYRGSSGFMAPAVHEAEQEAAAQPVVAQSGMLWSVNYAVIALVLAARFGKGGNALRIGTIVYGAWLCVVGTFALGLTASSAPAAIVMTALAELAAGVLLIFFMVQKDGVAWFSRPRH
ncbi:hypothetical protein OHA19_02430 [Streptomyces sp. NBC_00012]|uniref:hypothetical protein n=1 Tax=unclassified Streptomyces TaxID=2593676 RepID=UPI0032527EAC